MSPKPHLKQVHSAIFQVSSLALFHGYYIPGKLTNNGNPHFHLCCCITIADGMATKTIPSIRNKELQMLLNT